MLEETTLRRVNGAQIKMDVFFDCEFTRLPAPLDGRPELISIGCIAENGSEFYAELTDTWDEGQCSTFTLDHVLPLLQGGDSAMEVGALAMRLAAWIQDLSDGQVKFYSDAPHFDWPFVREIFDSHGWPTNLVRQCGHACSFESDAQRFRYSAAIADFWRTGMASGARQHHALWDARSICFARRYALRRED